jgi:4-hydroxy-tetrahydrodipicolinate synthase
MPKGTGTGGTVFDANAWKGVFPATVLPLAANFEIDETDLRGLIRWLMMVKGVSGLACNGHAGDAWSLTRQERQRVTEIHVEEAAGRIPIICGISGNTTRDYIDSMADAKEAGADAVLVIPPPMFRGVSARGADQPFAFFSDLADAVDIPIIIFQHMISLGNNYSPQTLAKLTEIDNIVAIKASTGDYKLYEQELLALRTAPRRISILASSDVLLFPYFSLGHWDGTLVSLASLAPHWIVDFVEAFARDDIVAARAIWEQLYPVVELFYKTLGINNSAFIKEALHLMGVLANPGRMRKPHPTFSDHDREAIRALLERAGLLALYRSAAA